MKAINILWDVKFPHDLETLPRIVYIPSDAEGEDAAANYLSRLTGLRAMGFQLVPAETDASAYPKRDDTPSSRAVLRGDNLPFWLFNSLQPTRPGHRLSSKLVFDENNEKPRFFVQLNEDEVPGDPFQSIYTLTYWDVKGWMPIAGHTGTIKGTSILNALRSDLRKTLGHLFGKDPYWLFGKSELTPVEQYLYTTETTVELAHRMVDELEANAGQSKETSLFTLATLLVDGSHKGAVPDVRVRLLDRSNSDYPLSVEVICDIEPSFIDIRPVVGSCEVYGTASTLDEVLTQIATMLSQRSTPFRPIGFWGTTDAYERLSEIPVGANNALTFLFDESLLFAYALHKMLGYEVECLCEPSESADDPWYCRIIHAYCVKDDLLIDARGVTKDRSAFFALWKGQMVPMRETIVLSHNAIEGALDRCIPRGREQAWYRSVADFIRGLCCYYDI